MKMRQQQISLLRDGSRFICYGPKYAGPVVIDSGNVRRDDKRGRAERSYINPEDVRDLIPLKSAT